MPQQRLIKIIDPSLYSLLSKASFSESIHPKISSNFILEQNGNHTPSEQEWFLQQDNQQLTLKGVLQQQTFSLSFDLQSAQLNYRRQHGGGRKEPLAKAVGLKKAKTPFVIDTTAGMGREALLLTSMGCKVLAIERQPVIYLLLNDAINRLYLNGDRGLSASQLKLIHANSTDYLTDLNRQKNSEKPQVIYMDPMFPDRNKSAAVKKEMRIFKQLAGEDMDAAELLTIACKVAEERVVVKRPASAPFIAERSPSFQITSKKHRFDVYLTNNEQLQT